MNTVFQIHPEDNVAVCLQQMPAGSTVVCGSRTVTAQTDIPAGHKIALCPIAKEAKIMKYGFPIGHAAVDIPAGSWVHTQNVKSDLGPLLTYSYHPDFQEQIPQMPQTFQGYRRADGSVGIRNEVWIIPTVGCVNAVARQIEQNAQKYLTENIDGICSYSHPYGCSQLGGDQEMTLKALSGLIRHPNAGAVLVLSLGCENSNLQELKRFLGGYDKERVRFLVCQEQENELEAADQIMQELCAYAGRFHRESVPADKLVVGLKCGGSDGFSGITANPLVGAFSDKLTAQGGTTILTEVPEMFGAEQMLMNRCRDQEVFQKTVDLINHFKGYFMKYGEKINENPSPGNKAGGITTLEDKSLGCVQKGGKAPVEDVLNYGEPVRSKGLNLLQSPGNDLVAACALAYSGAHLILFTTGRGTPFGCPVPTVKISSNTRLAKFKKNWIDFNAGVLLEGAAMSDTAQNLFQYVLRLASGEVHTHSEGLEKHELAIFKDGVTL